MSVRASRMRTVLAVVLFVLSGTILWQQDFTKTYLVALLCLNVALALLLCWPLLLQRGQKGVQSTLVVKQRLRESLERQRQLLVQMVAAQTEPVANLMQETEAILEYFQQHYQGLWHKQTQEVAKLANLVVQLQSLQVLFSEIKAVSSQASLVADNATMLAGSKSQAMTTAQEVKAIAALTDTENQVLTSNIEDLTALLVCLKTTLDDLILSGTNLSETSAQRLQELLQDYRQTNQLLLGKLQEVLALNYVMLDDADYLLRLY